MLDAPSPTPRAVSDPGPPQSGRSGVRPAQDKTGHPPAPRARPMGRRPVRDLRWLVVAVARAEDLSCGGAGAVSLSRLTTRKLGWFGERGVWRGWFSPVCPELDTLPTVAT